MSRILFVMLHPGFIRYYEDALHSLAAAGHHVHVAFETSREKLRESELARRLEQSSERITCGTTPPRVESVRAFLARSDRTATRGGDSVRPATAREQREEAWESLATTVRLLLDYLRFFEPAFINAGKLRDRAEKRLPDIYVRLARFTARMGEAARHALAACLRGVERAIPTHPAIEGFVRDQNPDLLLVTPLIELGSQQVDYVKAARRAGVRSALCVASWDNLTSKGLIRVTPDHVVVWNDAQKQEAVSLHGVPPDRVLVTGAQLFDRWFDAQPSGSREEFCRRVGLDPGRPFILYVGSSIFIAPEEVPFAERWLSRLRAAGTSLASVGVLLRPHPANSRQWRAFNAAPFANVAIWPPIGSDPNSADAPRDYFDSLYHSAAVVGINTSAQIEAGIVGRPVFTVQTPEFAHAQAGTLHFHHLVNGHSGLVHSASTLDEHVAQLAAVLEGNAGAGDANRRFVRSFIRPFGEREPAVPKFRDAIAALAAMPKLQQQREGALAAAGRVPALALAHLARTLAEGRPLWIYALRPFVTAGIWIWSIAFRFGRASSRGLGRHGRRANKALSKAARRAVKRA